MHKYMELTKEQIRAMTLDEARRLIDGNGWTDRCILHRECKQLYNFLYRKGAIGLVYEGTENRISYDGNTGPKKYDITKVLPYLERWAVESDTTIRKQAGKYGYGKLWLVYCRENNVDVNTKKIDLENEKEK